jgi:16S rRNA (adenine1518-N6/adenine1519-N6)-dimethyltransferase
MRKSSLGQNFLFDRSILQSIVEVAGLSKKDTVVEIGPGPGSLTRLLAEKVKRVVAIEFDGKLFERLKQDLIGYRNVELVLGDALKFPYEDIGEFKVVANIPYYITTPILFRLLDAKKHLKTMTLTIQKEVAQRIVAGPGGRDYGVLSIMVQYQTNPELKFVIPKEAFRPAPKVDSAVVHIEILEKPSVIVKNEKIFARVIKTAFSQRRKTLSNSLKGFGKDIGEKLLQCEIDPRRRPETLSLDEFACLADALKENNED